MKAFENKKPLEKMYSHHQCPVLPDGDDTGQYLAEQKSLMIDHFDFPWITSGPAERKSKTKNTEFSPKRTAL